MKIRKKLRRERGDHSLEELEELYYKIRLWSSDWAISTIPELLNWLYEEIEWRREREDECEHDFEEINRLNNVEGEG